MIKDNCVQSNDGNSNDVNLKCVSCAPWPAASSCKCDRGFYNNIKTKDLGQHAWAKVSKKQLSQIDIQLLDNKCQDLSQFMAQQTPHTGFIPLSPLQFGEIRQCNKCVHDPKLCKDPLKLYKIVYSFKCPNFLGAHVQVNYDMNLDLLEK